ncbi:MAG: secretin N-terminal domain-containing protein [Planctomycetota bacterium]|jgi:type IV pilus assembly protein PilQ
MRNAREFRRSNMLLILLLIMGACAVAAAENGTEDANKAAPTTLEERMKRVISVDFRDTEIDDVIRIIAKKADTDIVKSPKVTGRVTATLTDVPLEEALHHILAAHGFSYVASENMLRVVPAEEVTEALEAVVSKVYRVTYADVKEVELALRKFISQRGSISSNPGTSNIIVTDTESKVKAIDSFMAEIDRVTPQILVEARIYDVETSDQLDLGFEWLFGRNTAYGGSGVGDVGEGATGRTEPFITGALESAITQTPKTDGLLRFGVLNDSIDLDVLFTANQENIHATLLASPRVLVLDNEEATFKIIEEIPFQELTQTAGGGNIGTTEFKEVGVELYVIPHVTRDGMIRMQVNPKFSTQTDTVEIVIPVPGSTPITSPQPVVDKREAITRVLVRDGQTVVLGGLRKKAIGQEVSKIPLLGDLPAVGGLFRFEGEKIVRTELLVFVTPRIVEEAVLSEVEAAQFEVTEIDSPEPPSLKIDRTAKQVGE